MLTASIKYGLSSRQTGDLIGCRPACFCKKPFAATRKILYMFIYKLLLTWMVFVCACAIDCKVSDFFDTSAMLGKDKNACVQKQSTPTLKTHFEAKLLEYRKYDCCFARTLMKYGAHLIEPGGDAGILWNGAVPQKIAAQPLIILSESVPRDYPQWK